MCDYSSFEILPLLVYYHFCASCISSFGGVLFFCFFVFFWDLVHENRAGKQWNRLHREALLSPSLEVFKIWLDKSVSNLVWTALETSWCPFQTHWSHDFLKMWERGGAKGAHLLWNRIITISSMAVRSRGVMSVLCNDVSQFICMMFLDISEWYIWMPEIKSKEM